MKIIISNQCERLAVETSQGERNKIAADEHQPAWKVETPEERETRLEFYSTRYREQPVQSQLPLFQQCLMFKPRCKIFIRIWVHLTRQHAQLVQKHFPTSIVNQSLMIICVVIMTSMLQNYTPLPTIADLCLKVKWQWILFLHVLYIIGILVVCW